MAEHPSLSSHPIRISAEGHTGKVHMADRSHGPCSHMDLRNGRVDMAAPSHVGTSLTRFVAP
eukprot:7941377-Pyramimonas_sp.AAC.1